MIVTEKLLTTAADLSWANLYASMQSLLICLRQTVNYSARSMRLDKSMSATAYESTVDKSGNKDALE